MFNASHSNLKFDDIPEKFSESAVPVTYDEVLGEGWLLSYAGNAFLVWRYPDGYILTVQLLVLANGGPTVEQMDGLRRVMGQVIPKVPELAAAHLAFVKVPSPTPTPDPTSTP